MVLNSAISDLKKAQDLWNKAALKVLVDGGANRWMDLGLTPNADLLTGDFDSIRPEVKAKFDASKVIETPDQNNTDFTKSLLEISKLDRELDYVLVFVENSGRLDHIFSLFETLFHAQNIEKLPPVVLVSSTSLTWLLAPGKHTIRTTDHRLSCGLIPLGEACKNVTTTGLKWNLNGDTLAFGHLVSTSNTFDPEIGRVTVETDGHLLWTCCSD